MNDATLHRAARVNIGQALTYAQLLALNTNTDRHIARNAAKAIRERRYKPLRDGLY